MSNMLIGVLVDVSGSMREYMQLKCGIDDLQNEQITRVQSIFTTIINIVQHEAKYYKHELFAVAFGLEDIAVCDLLTLLDVVTRTKRRGLSTDLVREDLTELFGNNGAPGMNADVWDNFPHEFVEFILSLIQFDEKVLKVMVKRLPDYLHFTRSNINYHQQLTEMFQQNGISFVTEKVWDGVQEKQLKVFYLAAKLDMQTIVTELFPRTKRDDSFYAESGQIPPRNSDARASRQHVEDLVALLAKHGAPYARNFVEKYITPAEAELFCNAFCDDIPALETLVDELPAECKQYMTVRYAAAKSLQYSGITSLEDKERKETRSHADRAMLVARQIIKEKLLRKMQELVETVLRQRVLRDALLVLLKQITRPKIYQFISVVKLLNELTGESQSELTPLKTKLTASQLSRLSRSIEPFIFGGTPMCEALRVAAFTFTSAPANPMVLFLISDGQAADGDPTAITKRLKEQGVIIFTCLLTSENIAKPRQLYYRIDPSWKKDQRDMFEMSSVTENSHSLLSVLLDQRWTLPSEGKSHLFLQANHPDIINEFSSLVHKVAETNNVILNIMGRVSLDMYINSAMSTFEPEKQVGGTCYAHAVAAVLHLATRRIYGREGGVPDFVLLRDELIRQYGDKGASTKKVLDEWCPKYRLNYREMDENGARQAINARRPVVAKFYLDGIKWGAFSEFFRVHPQGILQEKDLSNLTRNGTPGGHAVVLIKIDPDYLLFMNSWGTTWADGGFFRVQDQTVLNLTFYDVYWTLNDLLPSEIRAYEAKCKEIGNDVMKKVPESVKQLPYECPKCATPSPACTFEGHLLQATCPKCHQAFEPTALGFLLNS